MQPQQKSVSHTHSCSGFSLVEMLFAMTIGMLVLAIGIGSVLFITRGFAALINYTDMNNSSRQALEIFGRDVRMGVRVDVSTSDQLIFDTARSFSMGTNSVTYTYDATAGTFTRQVDSDPPQVLLQNISQLNINYFTFRHNPTTHPLEVKEVQIEAVMELQALDLTNTNHIISAQFMMRNKSVAQ